MGNGRNLTMIGMFLLNKDKCLESFTECWELINGSEATANLKLRVLFRLTLAQDDCGKLIPKDRFEEVGSLYSQIPDSDADEEVTHIYTFVKKICQPEDQNTYNSFLDCINALNTNDYQNAFIMAIYVARRYSITLQVDKSKQFLLIAESVKLKYPHPYLKLYYDYFYLHIMSTLNNLSDSSVIPLWRKLLTTAQRWATDEPNFALLICNDLLSFGNKINNSFLPFIFKLLIDTRSKVTDNTSIWGNLAFNIFITNKFWRLP